MTTARRSMSLFEVGAQYRFNGLRVQFREKERTPSGTDYLPDSLGNDERVITIRGISVQGRVQYVVTAPNWDGTKPVAQPVIGSIPLWEAQLLIDERIWDYFGEEEKEYVDV